MILENSTWLPAELSVAALLGAPRRVGLVVAKATYRVAGDGTTIQEEENPFPIFPGEEETELGLLPADLLPRADSAFEVVLLGKAYVPGGRPLPALTVALTVGDVRREMAIFGDRYWTPGPWNSSEPVISKPEPFVEMPLVWGRAFGGTKEVLIDVDSPIEIMHAANPAGKGFDPHPQVVALRQALGAPDGFPTYDHTRSLPNLEDPSHLIRAWDDDPAPHCWATVPISSTLHVSRGMELSENPDPEAGPVLTDGFHHRAHPDWVIRLPERHAPVILEGMVPDWGMAFRIPALRVVGDWVLGEDRGTFELAPQGMVLLPEERRFYLVYRRLFPLPHPSEEDRSLRLRTEPGWPDPVREVR